MKLVIVFRVFLFSALLLSKHINADLAITDIKGLYTSIKPGYEYWSPIHGVIAVRTDFLRNLFLMEMQEEERRKKEPAQTNEEKEEAKNHSLILAMLRQFFNINPGDKTLRITQSKTSIGSYLMPVLLADLVNYITTDQIMDKKLIAKKDSEFARFLLKEAGIRGINNNKITQFIRNIRDMVSKSAAKEYYALPYIGQAILMTWLIKKVDTKKQITDFFDRLVELKNPLISESYDREKFLSAEYQQSDVAILFDELSKIKINNCNKDLLVLYEDLIFISYARLPIQGERIALYEFPEYREGFPVPFESLKKTFSDCVETSLRIFINELLKTGVSFDYHTLEMHGILFNSIIKKFYDTHHDFKTVGSAEVHEAWLAAVSNIKKFLIEYKNVSGETGESCEIKSTVRNVLQIIRYIFEPTSDETLGIKPIPEIVTIGYMIDFFSHLLAAVSQALQPRKIELLSIKIVDKAARNKSITISSDALQQDNFPKKEEDCNLYHIIINFIDVSSGHVFYLSIDPNYHTYMKSRKEEIIVKPKGLDAIYYDILNHGCSIENSAFLDILNVIYANEFFESYIRTILKGEYCNRILLVSRGKNVIYIVHSLIEEFSYGKVQDRPFLFYLLPSSIFKYESVVQQTSDLSALISMMISNESFDVTIAKSYLKELVESLFKLRDDSQDEFFDIYCRIMLGLIPSIINAKREKFYIIGINLLNSLLIPRGYPLLTTLVRFYRNEDFMKLVLENFMPALSVSLLTKEDKETIVYFLQETIFFYPNLELFFQEQKKKFFGEEFV